MKNQAIDPAIDKILNLSQQILQNQSNILTAVLGITALLLACTWLWNLFISKRQIKNKIRANISRIEKDFSKRIDNKMTEVENKIKETLKKDLLFHEAELNRLFALTSAQAGHIPISTRWWARALESYNKLGQDDWIRISTDDILKNLKKPEVCEKLDKSELQEIKDMVKQNVPDILAKEREEILKILEAELKKK